MSAAAEPMMARNGDNCFHVRGTLSRPRAFSATAPMMLRGRRSDQELRPPTRRGRARGGYDGPGFDRAMRCGRERPANPMPRPLGTAAGMAAGEYLVGLCLLLLLLPALA